MIVNWSDRGGGGCSNMRKTCSCGGIAADAVEVCIVRRRLAVLVDRRPFTTAVAEIGSGLGVPCYAKAVDIEESIAQGNFCLCCQAVRLVRNWFW